MSGEKLLSVLLLWTATTLKKKLCQDKLTIKRFLSEIPLTKIECISGQKVIFKIQHHPSHLEKGIVSRPAVFST